MTLSTNTYFVTLGINGTQHNKNMPLSLVSMLSVAMLNVIMLNIITLNIVMLKIVMLNGTVCFENTKQLSK